MLTDFSKIKKSIEREENEFCCIREKLSCCWQWAGPSEHICYRAGFREKFSMESGWAKLITNQ